ncbi:MAG TPA: YggS family pyridoxal phosphate-dependent enzyme [Terriglobales bacterium]|nr:YggS family pyridoxal phosphate-dependent enzyme [Terriglobales bacterium]
MSIADNIARVRERMAAAGLRAGRWPDEIKLMAVSKTVEPERIGEAYAAGIRLFGENRVQEFESKAAALHDLAEAEWHLIGHLQSNKAKKAAELFGAVDSVDSLKLARKLDEAAEKPLPVLIEINIGGEEAKSGVDPHSGDLEELLRAEFKKVEVRGLMAIPPFTEDPEGARPYFRRMRELREEVARKWPGVRELSIGMSHDFEVAIEEGSTCVRVGTAIFGERAKK